MFSMDKEQKQTSITVEFDEHLTSNSCSKMIIELIKYILYQKQQIPFSCDTLSHLHSRIKPSDRNFNSTNSLLTTLDNITEQLTSQFHINGCDVKEIVIIIGATTVSPKFCIKFELPSFILSSKTHFEYQHSYRKPLLHLMRSLLKSEEFQEAMTIPLCPTNTFVFVQKSDPNPKSDFFLPKPQYAPPVQTAACILIKLHHHANIPLDCTCSNIVRVYSDEQEDEHHDNDDKNTCYSEINTPYIWYQSRAIVKGFKYFR